MISLSTAATVGRLASWISSKIQGLESTLACKQPSIDSGATAIGSAARAPDQKFEYLLMKIYQATRIKQATIGAVFIVTTPCHPFKFEYSLKDTSF